MSAAVLRQPGSVAIEDVPMPALKPEDVLVALDYVGICGSDLHLFEHGRIGSHTVTQPMVLGHEPGGTVVKVGSAVTHLRIGDRVAVEPGIPCWKCDYCKSGRYNLCPSVYFYASLPVVEGCFAEYIAHPETLCYKLPDNVTTMEGALMEPLAVGYHAVLQSGVQAGSSAVVLGAGCIGMTTILSLRCMGVHDITVVDVMEKRLHKALALGASHAINAAKEDAVEVVRALTQGGADAVFETAGAEATTFQTGKMARRGGTIVFVGYTQQGTPKLDLNHIIDNEITMKTVFRYRNIYPKVIAAVANGSIRLRDLEPALFDFQDIQLAMEYAVGHKAEVTKCVVRIRPDAMS